MPNDLRQAYRSLIRNPGFSAIAVLTLALGIGANSAVFSVISAVLIHRLPYRSPERLVQIFLTEDGRGRFPLALLDYRGLKERSRSFDGIAAFGYGTTYNLTGGDRPERLRGVRVSADFFSLLGAEPELGRTFAPGEDQPGHDLVVLSHELWQTQLGGDPDLLGQTLILNGRPFSVVGIMPATFRFPRWAQLWTPMDASAEPAGFAGGRYLAALGRFRAGLSVAEAQAEIDTLTSRLEWKRSEVDVGVLLVPLQENLTGGIRPALLMLLGAVGFVLLIGCVNVASLLLARACGRERETALRLALGIGRLGLIRQFLAEGLALALSGGALGVLLAGWGVELLKRLQPEGLPRWHELGIDDRTLLFTAAASTLCAILFSLAPVRKALGTDINESLKRGARFAAGGRSHWPVFHALMVFQIALSVVLLTGTGLLARSFWNMSGQEPGFEPRNALAASLSLPRAKYRNYQHRVDFFRQVRERLAGLQGVEAVGATSFSAPMDPGPGSLRYQSQSPSGAPVEEPASYRFVSPGYFKALGMPLLAGRDLTESEVAQGAHVAVVSAQIPRRLWPGDDPLGRILRIQETDFSVVGVTVDIREYGMDREPMPAIYLPGVQSDMTLVVRTSGDPLAMVPALRGELLDLDRDLPLYNATTLEAVVGQSSAGRRFNALLAGLFTVLGVTLAMVGVYGTMAYAVGRRTHEFGVRLALGAQSADLMHSVLKRGLRLGLAGAAIGTAGSVAVGRLISGLLYRVGSFDFWTLALVLVLLMASMLLACYPTARRAASADPIRALRWE